MAVELTHLTERAMYRLRGNLLDGVRGEAACGAGPLQGDRHFGSYFVLNARPGARTAWPTCRLCRELLREAIDEAPPERQPVFDYTKELVIRR